MNHRLDINSCNTEDNELSDPDSDLRRKKPHKYCIILIHTISHQLDHLKDVKYLINQLFLKLISASVVSEIQPQIGPSQQRRLSSVTADGQVIPRECYFRPGQTKTALLLKISCFKAVFNLENTGIMSCGRTFS